ncbi:MAG: hypothetical protein J0L86_14965 [Flavobacteriales bacterium]|nr:hypothetical protein [Flavobacteriales bacterium]
MMFGNLNASNYEYSNNFYTAEFEDILSKIVSCYHLMLDDRINLTNNENEIRDVFLLNYLKDSQVRNKLGLLNYLFDREVPEDVGIGRTDIKIQTINTFYDNSAYYTIECKRLDAINVAGTTGLNSKYIENGIYRFVNKTYTSYYKINGMIGFVVQEIDIDKNIKSINYLLKDKFLSANTTKGLEVKKIHSNFKFCYRSEHGTPEHKILIYHLMFDFSKKISSTT